MGYKMKGAPMMDTSSKHGTNKNYMMSGMGKDGAPFLGGIMKAAKGVLGGVHKGVGGLLGLNKGRGGCPPAAPAAPAPTSVSPPPPPPPPPAVAEEAGAQMHANMKVGAPKYKSAAQRKAVHASKADGGKGAPMYGKKGAPKLKGGQHKIDMNKDGKLSKADFDMMNKKGGAPNYKKGYYGVK